MCTSFGDQAFKIAKVRVVVGVAKGFEAVFQNAKQGIDGMPPMGVCMDCSDAELKAAMQEMLRF